MGERGCQAPVHCTLPLCTPSVETRVRPVPALRTVAASRISRACWSADAELLLLLLEKAEAELLAPKWVPLALRSASARSGDDSPSAVRGRRLLA